MIDVWFFPLLDYLFVPLLYLWNSISLTIVSLLVGLVLIVVYYLTSDQWGLAYYKQEMKEHQNRLLHGDYSLGNFVGLLRDNASLASYGLIPAIFTVIPIIILIPWVGSRFGLRTVPVNQPFTATITSSEPFELQFPPDLRVSTTKRSYEAGTVTLRMLAEAGGRSVIRLESSSGATVDLPIAVDQPWANAWPTLVKQRWYHALLVPAGDVLASNQPVDSFTVDYDENFRSLSVDIPGMARLPGWLSYFFIVSFISGLAVKWHYSIE